jgi:hypothetical protein
MELPAGADGKLGEHLAHVVLNGAGADEQAGTNLRVRQTLSGQPRDLGLLGSQRSARLGGLGGALTGSLAGGQQLAAGALGERLHPHCAQHLACDAQLVARLGDTALAAQPPAVEQARTGQLGTKPGPAKVEPITAGSV